MGVEIKEINLRHWVWDVAIIVLMVSIIIGTLGVFGITPHIQPYNIHEVYSNNFSHISNNSTLFMINQNNLFIYNETEKALQLNNSDIIPYANNGNIDRYTFIRIKNPTPSKDILIISMNVTLSNSKEMGIYGSGSTPEEITNLVYLGIAPRENAISNPQNDTGLYDVIYMPYNKIYPTIGTTICGFAGFRSSEFMQAQTILEKTQPSEDLWYIPNAIDRIDTDSFESSMSTNFNVPLVDYPATQSEEYHGYTYSLIKNVRVYFIFNFKEPSKSAIVMQYLTEDMQHREIILPMLLPIYEKANYINIILYYHTYNLVEPRLSPIHVLNTRDNADVIPKKIDPFPIIPYRTPNNYPKSVVTFGDLKIYSADETVNYSSIASALFLVYGLLGVATIVSYGLVSERRFNSAELLVLFMAILIGMVGLISYLIPEILINSATIVLTILTLSFGMVWGAFATGKIEFKGQIDEWLANHGDALTIGLAVLTALQYFFTIFP